jgi:hypothetical protein
MPTKIAAQHGVSCGRVSQIVAANRALEERRAVLEAQYGKHPDVARLSDKTPLDVLMLCSSATHGWAVRVHALCGGPEPIRTLGDLRQLTDAKLHARPGVGARLFAGLRALCPHTQKMGPRAKEVVEV